MEPLEMASVALLYVVLQGAALLSFTGKWRFAAILPVPVLVILMLFAVTGGLLGYPDADLAAFIAIPAGLVYLVFLLALSRLSMMLLPSTE